MPIASTLGETVKEGRIAYARRQPCGGLVHIFRQIDATFMGITQVLWYTPIHWKLDKLLAMAGF